MRRSILEVGSHSVNELFVPVDDEYDLDRIVALSEDGFNDLDEVAVWLAGVHTDNDRDPSFEPNCAQY
jgi:hypothetical protein